MFVYDFKIQEKGSKETILETFGKDKRASIIKAIRNAYKWVSIWENDPNNEVLVRHQKKDVHGIVIKVACEYYLINEIQKGYLDLDYEFRYNRNFSSKHLVLRDLDGKYEITVNQLVSL